MFIITSARAPFVTWLVVLAAASVVRAGSYAGPYLVNLKAFTNCPRLEVGDQINPRDVDVRSILKHNHTTKLPVVDFNITVFNNLFTRSAAKVSLDIAKWDTVSGWREHFLVMPLGEACFVLEEIVGNAMESLSTAASAPKQCPIPNRFYSGGNIPAQWASLGHFPSLPYGRFRVYTLFSHAKTIRGPQIRGCFRLVVDLVPKM